MRHTLACHAHLVFDDAELASTSVPRATPPPRNAPPPSRTIEHADAASPAGPNVPNGALRLTEPGLLPPKLAVMLVALLPLVLGA